MWMANEFFDQDELELESVDVSSWHCNFDPIGRLRPRFSDIIISGYTKRNSSVNEIHITSTE